MTRDRYDFIATLNPIKFLTSHKKARPLIVSRSVNERVWCTNPSVGLDTHFTARHHLA